MGRCLLKRWVVFMLPLAVVLLLPACATTLGRKINQWNADSAVSDYCKDECETKHQNFEAWKYKNITPDQYDACLAQTITPSSGKARKAVGKTKKRSKKGNQEEVMVAPTQDMTSTLKLKKMIVEADEKREAISAQAERNPAFQQCMKNAGATSYSSLVKECKDNMQKNGTAKQQSAYGNIAAEMAMGATKEKYGSNKLGLPTMSFQSTVSYFNKAIIAADNQKTAMPRLQAILRQQIKAAPNAVNLRTLDILPCQEREQTICSNERLFKEATSQDQISAMHFLQTEKDKEIEFFNQNRKYSRCTSAGVKETCEYEEKKEVEACVGEKRSDDVIVLWRQSCDISCHYSPQGVAMLEERGIFGQEEWDAFEEGWKAGDKIGEQAKHLAESLGRLGTGLNIEGASLYGLAAGLVISPVVTLVSGTLKSDVLTGKARASVKMRNEDLQKMNAAMEQSIKRWRQENAALSAQVAELQKSLGQARADEARVKELGKQQEEMLNKLQIRIKGLQEEGNKWDYYIGALHDPQQRQQWQIQRDALAGEVTKLEALNKTLAEGA